MGTYDILIHGHEGQVMVAINGNTFEGAIKSADGTGYVSGTVADDGTLIGTAKMNDHTASFVATISGKEITGHIKVFGWPLSFSGIQIA